MKVIEACDLIEMTFGSPISIMSDCLRGMMIAKPGHEFIAADFSAIEARGLAWLAGQESVLEIFRGEGKIYEHAASGIYRVSVGDVTPTQRQIGKVAVLALGYGGGKGAFKQMAKGYGVKVTDEEAEEIKTAWRNTNKKIVDYWYSLEKAAIDAIINPGQVFSAGKHPTHFKKNGSFLFAKLPSGRVLTYPYPAVEEIDTPWGDKKIGMTYMSEDSLTRQWSKQKTYGGSLSENMTQAVCRDILAEAIIRLEEKTEVVLHCHDEVVIECPKDKFTVAEIEELISVVPDWAKGFPIKAEGWKGIRYQK